LVETELSGVVEMARSRQNADESTTLDSLFLMLQRPALRLRCRFGFSSACLLNHGIKYLHVEALFRLGQPGNEF